MPRPPKIPEITPEELARSLENGETMNVLDIRAPARLVAGRIEAEGQFHNIVGSRLATLGSPDAVGLDPSVPVAVVCGHGNSSKAATRHLAKLGFQARSLQGGMAAWMLTAIPRPLPGPHGAEHLVQFDRIGKGALGYLLVSDGEALIVDPPRRPDGYLTTARELGATVVGVADTHVHADYISGGPALAAQLGVPYYLHPADAVYPYDGTPGRIDFSVIEDGDTIEVGTCTIRVAHTPGHTEGSVTYFAGDDAAFTGDFVFVQSVGRPDLAGKTEEWTARLWQSLERAKRDWPDDLLIYPAHYASQGERRDDRTVGRQWGELRRANKALRIADETAFQSWVRNATRDFPHAYKEIKAINVGLQQADEARAEELEMGKNECALA